MYAARRTYVKQWDHQSPEDRYTVDVKRGGEAAIGIDPKRIAYVEEEVMTWRKANQIHKWFVDNVQNGVDDCQTYDVDWVVLTELLAACNRVIEASKLVDGMVLMSQTWDPETARWIDNREPGKVIEDPSVAREILPCCEGFFFGGDEYDEYYLGDVVATRDWIKRMMTDYDAGAPGHIIYSSSW